MAAISISSIRFQLTAGGELANELDNTGRKSISSFDVEGVETAISPGIDVSQCSRIYEKLDLEIQDGDTTDVDLRTMANLDVGTGQGNDALGQPILFEEIVSIVITKNGGTGRLEINPSTPDDFFPYIAQQEASDSNGNAMRDGCSWGVFDPSENAFPTSATDKNVRFGAVGGNVTMSLYVIGRHDVDDSSSSSVSSSSSSSSSVSSSSFSSSSSSSHSSSSASSQSSSSSSSST